MREVAEELSAPLIDSSVFFFGGRVNDLFFDDVHPTPRGHSLIATALFEGLER